MRSHAHKLTKKVRLLGLKSALSQKAADGQLKVIDTLTLDKPSTSAVLKQFEKLGFEKPLFVRGDNPKDDFSRSIRNIPYADEIPQYGLNVYDILSHGHVVITEHALKDLEARLAA